MPLHAMPEPTPSSLELHLEVPAEASEISGLRRRVCALAAEAGLTHERRAEVALAVGEACANVVIHAYLDEPEPGTIAVVAAATPDGFFVGVRDRGRGMVPRLDSPGMGLGLPLIASLTSSVEVNLVPSGGTEVRMLFFGEPVSAVWTRTT
jgi:serine/threonine-protein kinase RsbW